MHKKIPLGSYCYSYVPASGSGFYRIEAVYAYIDALPEEEQLAAHLKLTRVQHCPYWRYAGKGRVHCTLLKRTAVGWSRHSEHLAYRFYARHPKAKDRDKGCLLGDAVKECGINRGFKPVDVYTQ